MRLRNLTFGAAVCLWAGVGLGAAKVAALFRLPAVERRPLPADFLSIEEPSGMDLLRDTSRLDYELVAPHFVPQQRPNWSAPATVAILHNAFQVTGARLAAQDEVFDHSADPMVGFLTSWRGASLPDTARLMESNGLHASINYAEDANPRALRERLQDSGEDSADVVVVEFERSQLGLAGGRHVSVVGAYHAGTDRVLILDTASHAYPSAWIPLESLFTGMSALDPVSQQSGGWITVRRGERVASRTHAGALWSPRAQHAP